MKKVLIISSSPRKNGNSDTLCNQFALGATDAGNIVEKINLREEKINYCIGCGYCNSHKGECSQKDDMAKIGQKLIEANVIVLATPVYFYTMSAQLKTMIDRCCPYYTEIEKKEFYYILTAEDSNESMMQKTIDSLRGYVVDCLPNSIERGTIMGLSTWHMGDILNHPAMKQAYELGKKL